MSWITGVILPLAMLAALAVTLPRRIARWLPNTLAGVSVALALAALVLVAVGGALFAALYLAGAPQAGALLAGHPLASAGFFLRLGLLPALFWGPLLLLSGLALAQATEVRS